MGGFFFFFFTEKKAFLCVWSRLSTAWMSFSWFGLMLSGFQMLIPLHTDGRSNFKVCILCRKLQLTSKIRISLKIGWCLHACFVETQHTFLFYFFLKVVQTHSTPGKKKNQVHINILQETPRLVSHCQNKLNRFMKAIKKNLLPPCLERLFKKINTGKSSVQSVRTYFKRWNRCSEPVNVSVHTRSPFPFFFFFFKLSGSFSVHS